MIAFAGAIEPLRIANRMADRTLYEWRVVSASGGPVTASNGVALQADGGLEPVGRRRGDHRGRRRQREGRRSPSRC